MIKSRVFGLDIFSIIIREVEYSKDKHTLTKIKKLTNTRKDRN